MPDLLADPPTLERDSGVPVHVQIEHWLTTAISNLQPGARLPGERDLAAAIGVSRMTLRQALAGLADKGVLVRVAGRSGGAFVAEPKIDCDLTGLAGFTEQMRRAHRRAGARVLLAATIPAPRQVAVALEVPVGGSVHEVARVRSANRVPLALEHSYFPAAVFPDLLDHRLTGSLYTLLRKSYGQQPHTAVEYLEPVKPTPSEASALSVDADTPLMLIERTAYSAAGLPIEFARDIFRPDRIRIMVRTGP